MVVKLEFPSEATYLNTFTLLFQYAGDKLRLIKDVMVNIF
jgi:hypothetical protein